MSDIETVLKMTNKAFSLCEKDFSHDELVSFIKHGSDDEKQISILMLKSIESQKEADLLIFLLTNQHGTVREATAEKINELMHFQTYRCYFQTSEAHEKFLAAVNDVNPNICRYIIDILPFLDNRQTFLENLYAKTLLGIEEARVLNVRCRSHMYTKKIFNLYWCLEAISVLAEEPEKKLEEIIEKTYCSEEYTIREKTAKILIHLNCAEYSNILKKLSMDENFYVRLQCNLKQPS